MDEIEIEAAGSPAHSETSSSSDGSRVAASPDRGGAGSAAMKKGKKKHGSLPLKMFVSLGEEEMVRPDCPNASNPFHKCADYCFQNTAAAPHAKKHGKELKAFGRKEVKKVEARRHVDPNCRHASNPYHSCGPYCYEDISAEDQHVTEKGSSRLPSLPSLLLFKKGEKKKEGMKMLDTREVDTRCKNASNPFHKCVDYCFQKNSEKDQVHGTKTDLISNERKENAKTITKDGREETGKKRYVNPNCLHASNPYHVCGSYCLPNLPKGSSQYKVARPNQMSGNVKMAEQSSECKHASNPCHKCGEHCSNGIPTKTHDRKEEKSLDPKMMEKRNDHAKYVNASNHEKNQDMATESGVRNEFVKVNGKKDVDIGPSCDYGKQNQQSYQNFYEQDLIEKVGILTEGAADLEETEGRNMHHKDIDLFDLNHPYVAQCGHRSSEEEHVAQQKSKEDQKTKEGSEVINEDINACNPCDRSATICLKKFPEIDQFGDEKISLSPNSPLHFVLLLFSILYYIGRVIVTGGVVMQKNTGSTMF